MDLPPELQAAVSRLAESRECWDSERGMPLATLSARPVLSLVEAFLADVGEGAMRLRYLCLFVARRVLPVWQLYCDGRKPHRAIAALAQYLADGVVPLDAPELCIAARPSFGGQPMVDCRQGDTSCAAEAAAMALAFALGNDPMDAMECLSSAAAAIDQSPLNGRESFRRWLTEVAIPVAWEGREMSPAERELCRRYDPATIVPEGTAL